MRGVALPHFGHAISQILALAAFAILIILPGTDEEVRAMGSVSGSKQPAAQDYRKYGYLTVTDRTTGLRRVPAAVGIIRASDSGHTAFMVFAGHRSS